MPYLRTMDMFLLTSLREQMPMTVLEAMAVGIPVVATRVGEIPGIIDDGVDGFVVELDAPIKVFVGALDELFHAEPGNKWAITHGIKLSTVIKNAQWCSIIARSFRHLCNSYRGATACGERVIVVSLTAEGFSAV